RALATSKHHVRAQAIATHPWNGRFFNTPPASRWKIIQSTSIFHTLRNTSSRQALVWLRIAAETGLEGPKAPSQNQIHLVPNSTKESIMKKFAALLAAFVVLAGPLAAAKDDQKETDRLENCGVVLKEIMDIPDDIPQELIDKAECVIVYPSVIKGA